MRWRHFIKDEVEQTAHNGETQDEVKTSKYNHTFRSLKVSDSVKDDDKVFSSVRKRTELKGIVDLL